MCRRSTARWRASCARMRSVSAIFAANRSLGTPFGSLGTGNVNVFTKFRRFSQHGELVVGDFRETAGDEHVFRLAFDAEVEITDGQSGQKRNVMRQDAEFTFDTRNTDVIHGLADPNFVQV